MEQNAVTASVAAAPSISGIVADAGITHTNTRSLAMRLAVNLLETGKYTEEFKAYTKEAVKMLGDAGKFPFGEFKWELCNDGTYICNTINFVFETVDSELRENTTSSTINGLKEAIRIIDIKKTYEHKKLQDEEVTHISACPSCNMTLVIVSSADLESVGQDKEWYCNVCGSEGLRERATCESCNFDCCIEHCG